MSFEHIDWSNFARKKSDFSAEKPWKEVWKPLMELPPIEYFLKKDSDSDLILVIEDQKIFVHKSGLIFHSDYFKTVFNSNFKEKDQNQIVLEELKLDEFVHLLNVIYCLKPIDDSIIAKMADRKIIAKMADRFVCQRILNFCEKFYLKESKLPNGEKFMAAAKYNFIDLKKRVMDLIQTMDDIKYFRKDLKINELSDANKAVLLEKYDEIIECS